MKENGDTWLGISEKSWKDAAEDAVRRYEEDHGPPPRGEPVTLKVVELSVTVENPLHDYRVLLGPGG
jgi:hypothetical protein